MRVYFSYLIIFAIGCMLVGCSSDSSNEDTAKEGVFLDSTVNSMHYKTPTHEGYTTSGGTFKYETGEVIEFNIGNIKVGRTKAKDIITPLDLLQTKQLNDKRVIKMLVLLQSIDNDGYAANGITLSNALKQRASEVDIKNIDLRQDFDLDGLLVKLGIKRRVPDEYALGHFKQTLNDHRPDVEYGSFDDVKGVYDFATSDVVIEITEDGKIQAYKKRYITEDNNSICLQTLGVSHPYSKIDGMYLEHDSNTNTFSVTLSDKSVWGWKKRNNQIIALSNPLSVPDKSNTYNSYNIARSLCSYVFANVAGVYKPQDKELTSWQDTYPNVTDIPNNVITTIDTEGFVRMFEYRPKDDCLGAVPASFNRLDNKFLYKGKDPDNNRDYYYYYEDNYAYGWID